MWEIVSYGGGKKIMILLTFDYELFGSGRGCVIRDLVKPTGKILKVLDELGVKATFYVEQLEIDAIISLKSQYPVGSKEHADAVALEEQLLDMVQRGHDVQLHLHPQWYGAKYDENFWMLNFDLWRFSALPYKSEIYGMPGKYDLIKAGKESLEKRLRVVKPNYSCHSFRAGGYNVGEDKTSVEALVENGFKSDSSICFGYFSNSTLSRYDYTGVNSNLAYWFSRDTFLSGSSERCDDRACAELPLVSIFSSVIERLSLSRLFSAIKNRKLKKIEYIATTSNAVPRNKSALANSNFDVCLSGKYQIIRLIGEVNRIISSHGSSAPVVLIGHPKDYSMFSPMRKILKLMRNKGRFVTVDEYVNEVI